MKSKYFRKINANWGLFYLIVPSVPSQMLEYFFTFCTLFNILKLDFAEHFRNWEKCRESLQTSHSLTPTHTHGNHVLLQFSHNGQLHLQHIEELMRSENVPCPAVGVEQRHIKTCSQVLAQHCIVRSKLLFDFYRLLFSTFLKHVQSGLVHSC